MHVSSATTEILSSLMAAVVEDAFGPRHRVTMGRLDSIADVAALARVRSPAVVVVGDVVTLSPHWSGAAVQAGVTS